MAVTMSHASGGRRSSASDGSEPPVPGTDAAPAVPAGSAHPPRGGLPVKVAALRERHWSDSVEARGERRRFIAHNAVAAAGTLGAGVFGLLLQAIVSHHFRPMEYGQAFAVFSFFTILTQPAYGFGRVITWSTSRSRAMGRDSDGASNALLRITNNRLLIGGALVALVFVAGAPLVGEYLHVPALYVILGAVGLPFGMATPGLLASLQGQERWRSWSAASIAIAFSRVVCVLAFVIPFGVAGVLLGITVASVLIYGGLLAVVWPRLQRSRIRSSWRAHWRFLLLSLVSGVSVSVAMGSDVVLVQHFFGARAGGQFSSVAVTSRTLYFVLGSVGSVLFPKVAARHATSRGTKAIVAASVAVAVIGGLVGFVVFSAGGQLILHLFSGKAYEGGATYIGWYAMSMPLLAAVTMLTQTQQSLSDLGMLWVLVPGTLLKPVLVLLFHQSLFIVAVMGDISIGTLVLALTVRYVMWERRRQQTISGPRDSGAAADLQPVQPFDVAGAAQ